MNEQESRQRAHRTVDALLSRILAHDMAGFAALWAPDGTMDFPFATAESPAHLEGRGAVAAYVAEYNRIVLPRAVVSETRHDTGDPDTLVVEFTVDGTVVATGPDYRLDYVAVIMVGDTGVVSYRDYWNPLAVQDVLGRPSLAEAGR